MFDIKKESAFDKVKPSPLTVVKNEPSIIKKMVRSLEAGSASPKQCAESDYETFPFDCPITNVKIEAFDDAQLSEDEGTVGAGCTSYHAAVTKQELDIGPTELQPPDTHYKLQPSNPDPDYHIPLPIIEDIPQGHELLLLKEEKFTKQLDNDLDLRDFPGNMPPGMCGSMSQHIQRIKIDSESAHTDTAKQMNPHIELLAHSSRVRSRIVPQDATHHDNPYNSRNVRIVTGEKPFQCKPCGKKFATKTSLIRHVRMHTGEKPFECHSCGKMFAENQSLIRHTRVHTGEKPFKCQSCNKRFSQSAHLIRHMRVHAGEKPFKCNFCDQRFTQSAHLTAHRRVHSGEKSFECNSCGKRFERRTNLFRHTQVHTGEKPFECNSCGKRFARREHLITHLRGHTDEEPLKPFECKSCGQRFAERPKLTRHARVHTGEKPFKCNSCGKRFARSTPLIRHIHMHTGEKPFKCNSCDKRFSQSAYLNKHKRVHAAKKPF